MEELIVPYTIDALAARLTSLGLDFRKPEVNRIIRDIVMHRELAIQWDCYPNAVMVWTHRSGWIKTEYVQNDSL